MYMTVEIRGIRNKAVIRGIYPSTSPLIPQCDTIRSGIYGIEAIAKTKLKTTIKSGIVFFIFKIIYLVYFIT